MIHIKMIYCLYTSTFNFKTKIEPILMPDFVHTYVRMYACMYILRVGEEKSWYLRNLRNTNIPKDVRAWSGSLFLVIQLWDWNSVWKWKIKIAFHSIKVTVFTFLPSSILMISSWKKEELIRVVLMRIKIWPA